MTAGKLVDGGAIFEKHPEEGKDALFKGSVIVYSANSAEEVRGIIDKDIYATSGVWDLSKAQILPVSRVFHLHKFMLTKVVCPCRSRATSMTNIDVRNVYRNQRTGELVLSLKD